MKIAILGFGKEGQSVLRFLKKQPRYKSAEFWALDKSARIQTPRGVKRQVGAQYLKNLERFDLVFRSPGVPYNLPELRRARRDGVPISSATKLFFDATKNRTKNVIGITGSKGKTTTATLLYQILKAAKKEVFLVGNIGTPMLDVLPRLTRNSWVVLELSSFQLQDLTSSPRIAVMLEIFPEHLDMKGGHGGHQNLKEYYAAKANLVRHQRRGNLVFYLAHNPETKRLAVFGHGKKIPVGEIGFTLFREKDLRIPGVHSFRNAVAAATVARHLGVPARTIKETALRFRGVEHRLEFVRRISGVEFYNDSIATNPHAAAAAVQAFPERPLILIAGGYDKNLSYTPLARAIKKSKTRLVVLFGENMEKIRKAVQNSGASVRMAINLVQATRIAYRSAKSLGTRLPVIVVLSPGAASFDMFRGYADRGDRFKNLVKSL